MDDDARERTLDDDTIKYLEALLASIVAGAGAYAVTLFDFLFRARHFDAMLLPDTAHRDPTPAGARYLPPLTFLLLNQIFYFYVYPREERGPTRAVIEAMPGPIRHALDRIETSIRDPNLLAICSS